MEKLLESLGTQRISVTLLNVEGDLRLSLAQLRLHNVKKIVVNVGREMLPEFFQAVSYSHNDFQ